MITRIALPPYGQEISITDEEARSFTHAQESCASEFCVIHNPSDHHMKDWPITIRGDRFGALCERICEHGTGHPDPDSLAYVESLHKEEDRGYEGIHGCDGCCTP